MPEPSFWDKWEWARAHQKPEPKLVVNNAGATISPPAMAPLNAPRFNNLKSPGTPIIIDATGSQENKIEPGKAFCVVAIPVGKAMVKTGSQFEEAGFRGELAGAGMRLAGSGMPGMRQAGSGLLGIGMLSGGIGNGARTLGASLLHAATGNPRPFLSAQLSATANATPLLMRPLVDGALQTGIDDLYGPEGDLSCRW